MGVDDAPDLGIAAVQRQMRRRVRGWPRRPIAPCARLKVDGHEIAGSKAVVRHTARLDEHHPGRAIDPAGVTERQRDETGGEQGRVRLPDLFPKIDPSHATDAVDPRTTSVGGKTRTIE